MSIRFDLFMFVYIDIHTHKFEIRLFIFANKFIRYQIIIYNL